jgi:hypothetical protein
MGISIPKINEETDRGREGDIVIPDGKYYVRVIEAKEQEKKDGDGTFIAASYEILDAEKEDCSDAIGLRIFDIFSLTEAAIWKLAKWLDACYSPVKFEGSEIPNDIEGKEFVVRVKNEKYDGKENVRVKTFMPSSNWTGVTLRTDDDGNQIVESKSKPNAGKTAPKSGGKQVSV